MDVEFARHSEVQWTTDDWLSRLLETPCLRVSRKLADGDVSIAPPDAPGFYSIKAPTDNHGLVRDLFDKKFSLIDLHISLRLDGDLAELPSANIGRSTICLAERQHIPSLQSIAVECFGNSRFHRDPHIVLGLADQVWRQWINDAVEDTGRVVLVAQRYQQICGFISLRPMPDGFVSIDLFAVGQQFRRGRIGESLIGSVFSFAKKPAGILCETETWNTPALNFYGRLGFTSSSLSSIFHFHKMPS